MTVARTTNQCVRALADAGIEEARLEGELLIAEVTGKDRAWLLLHPDEALTSRQTGRLEELLARRLRREPLPYVFGHAEFYGLRFRVTPAAIIPRPETEILVEAAVERAQGIGAHLAADVGAGTGAIAITLAKQVPELRVLAIDVSSEALTLARENAEAHGVIDRVGLIRGDLLSAVGDRFDFVVANLPYIRTDEFPHLQPEVRDFEPRVALDGGDDGLALIRRLSVQLSRHLCTGGFAALEVGAGQAGEVGNLLVAGGLGAIEVVRDYAGIERVVIGWRKGRRR